MAIGDAYATATTYRAIVTKSDTGEDSEIDDDLKAVSRYLDNLLGRFFTKDASVVQRTYYPPGYLLGHPEAENPWKGIPWQRNLYVDDMSAAPTEIIVDEDRDGSFADEIAWASTDYQVMPLNADKQPEARPYTAIFIPSWSSKRGWPAGSQVRVTAQFGWPSVPKAIERATVHLAAILRLESPRATQRIAEGFDAVIGASRQAQEIICELEKHYKRITF